MLVFIGGEPFFNASIWAEDGDPNNLGAAGMWSAWVSSDHNWSTEDPNGGWGELAPTWEDDTVWEDEGDEPPDDGDETDGFMVLVDPSYVFPSTLTITWGDTWGITDRKIEYQDAAIHHKIEERSTANIRVLDASEDYLFEHGQEVVIREENDYSILFGGVISESIATRLSSVTTPAGLEHSISCTDYHYLAEQKYFNAAYVTPTPHQIINDILGVLEDEGITEGLIQEGDILNDQLFPYVTCASALDTICTIAGFVWWISEDKKLYAVVRTAYNAAWNITSGASVFRSGLSLSSVNPDYRNVQYIEGGTATTALKTEYWSGDGSSQTMPLGYPLAAVPTVTLSLAGGAYSPQTTGIKGVDMGKDWYWSSGDNTIVQDPAETPLNGTTDKLKVQYFGAYNLIVKVSQQAEITRNRISQGFGTGEVENLVVDNSILNQNSALDTAQKTLLAYAAQGLQLNYVTTTPGLACGVIQSVTLPIFGLSAEEFLIYSMDIKFKPGPNGTELVFYQIQACQGPVTQSWAKVICGIADLAKSSAIANVSQSNSIQGLSTFVKNWNAGDTPNPFISVVEGVLPSDPNFPCLDWYDVFPYLVVYVAGAEYFRKPVVSVTENLAGTEIDTTAILLTQECNGVPISHVGLWGGVNATNLPGTGIELRKDVFIKTKTVLESLQFDFVDVHW